MLCVILYMPNQTNPYFCKDFFILFELVTQIAIHFLNLIKMQILIGELCKLFLHRIRLVWRLSEFAFFVRLLR